MRAFGLFLLERDLLLAQLLGALALEVGVAAGVQLRPAAVQMQGVGGDVVEEFAVVRDQQQRAGVFEQPLLQPQHRVQIQVVGRFVEQQQVAGHHQRARQVQAHPPAAGKRGHRALVGLGREAEAVQQLAGAGGGVVAADFLQPDVRGGDRFPVFGGQRVGLGLQRGRHLGVAAQHEVDGRIRQRRGFLGNAGDAHLARQVDIALVRFQFAADGGEQAGFAGAVAADHAHPVTRVQGQIDIGQEQALAAPESEITQGNHDEKSIPGNRLRHPHDATPVSHLLINR